MMKTTTEKLKLWSPVMIGLVALAFTYPVGAVLAAMNAHRLEDPKKKKKYISFGIVYILLFVIFGYFAFGSGMTNMGWVINMVMSYTLYSEIKNEFEQNLQEDNIILEPWWKALLIGIGTVILAGLFYFLFAVVMTMFNS